MKCYVNTTTSFCGLQDMQSMQLNVRFILKQNKWCVKLHPTSLHIYSLRSFPGKLLEVSHVLAQKPHEAETEEHEGQ